MSTSPLSPMLEGLEVFFSRTLQVQCFMYVINYSVQLNNNKTSVTRRVSTFNLQLYCYQLESMPTLKMVNMNSTKAIPSLDNKSDIPWSC